MTTYFDAPTAVADKENRNLRPRVAAIRACTKCDLHQQRALACPGYWDSSVVDIMFIGMSPGADEDKLGRPFVGKAGRKLMELALSVWGKPLPSVGWTNMVRCHTPGNRPPTGVEIASCKEWLHAELDIARPKVVVLLGNSAIPLAFGNKKIGEVAGSARATGGLVYVACYHPAAVLHKKSPSMVESIKSSLCLARELAKSQGPI